MPALHDVIRRKSWSGIHCSVFEIEKYGRRFYLLHFFAIISNHAYSLVIKVLSENYLLNHPAVWFAVITVNNEIARDSLKVKAE